MLKGKSHKERHQPLSRQRYGLLEKKKDYKERAKDYHRKQDALRLLHEKAAFKNPDEFYMGMQSAQMVGKKGALHRQKKKGAGANERKASLSQDLAYATMKKVAETKHVVRLNQDLHRLAEAGQGNTHTLFFDDGAGKNQFDPEVYFDTVPELAMRHHNRPRKSKLATEPVLGLAAGEQGTRQLKKLLKKQRNEYETLEQREDRKGKLQGLMTDITLEKAILGKGRKRKVNAQDEDEKAKPVYKWKKERKR